MVKCRVCSAEIPEGWGFCPVCQTPVAFTLTQSQRFPIETYPEKEEEHWKTMVWLGAFIDGEGSFYIAPSHVEEYELWYLHGTFDISGELTSEWKEIASYWQGIYGGTLAEYWVTYKGKRTRMYRWRMYRAKQLLKFLNEIIHTSTLEKQTQKN